MRKRARILLLVLGAILPFGGTDLRAGTGTEDYCACCDTLELRMEERTGVRADLKLKKVLRRGTLNDFYFSSSLGDYPWKSPDVAFFKTLLQETFPVGSSGIGRIFVGRFSLEELVTPELPGSKVADFKYRRKLPPSVSFVSRVGARKFPKGLSGRYIAVWQSHGLFYDEAEDRWKWQRAALHRTVEDLYTQSYVLQLLIPMLENAGATVLTPRERDTRTDEIIADNDPSFELKMTGSFENVRGRGSYSEKGRWSSVENGFADTKVVYGGLDNPFLGGTARTVACNPSGETASAVWTAGFKERGRYAVYVSYKSLPKSSSCALYTVHHLGGDTDFIVNQNISGGTWVYLGTFDFEGEGSVRLSNATPKGSRFVSGSVVSADAVRFGGGMGKIGRGADSLHIAVSGFPCYAEGAMYNMQWSGFDAGIWHNWDRDYTNDYGSRGIWVNEMMKRGVPFDLSLAFHTDAGAAQGDSTIGTLAIYTSHNERGLKYPDGTSRLAARTYADFVQSQVVNDIRAGFNPEWRRRELADRSYSESRRADVPSMLLELLSHQNFQDMKYGADPSFRFCVCRAVYKGMLKFLSVRYGVPYAVQPLPVNSFRVSLDQSGKPGVILGWEGTPDPNEPTAEPTAYKVYTRIDGGAFDAGVEVTGKAYRRSIKPGHIYSFKVTALNDGGESFPSEILSAGLPEGVSRGTVAIVNNFTEVYAPASFSDEWHAGFNAREDSGMPYIEDICYVGENYDLNRASMWVSDEAPGFGASYTDHAAGKVAGNTFDFPYVHGRAVLESGRGFWSVSRDAFVRDGAEGCSAVDLICGKQRNVFPAGVRSAIEGCNAPLLISGANIGTAVHADSTGFGVRELGYRWISSHACPDGVINGGLRLNHEPNPGIYAVENPDSIQPADIRGSIEIKYRRSFLPAAVYTVGGSPARRVAAFGFPLEALTDRGEMDVLIAKALDYLQNIE